MTGVEIDIRQFETVSRQGTAVQELHRRNAPGGRGLAVLLPGQAYSCQRPLLHFARLTALHAGFDVLCLQFGFQASRRPGPDGDLATLADEARQAVSRAIEMTGPPARLAVVAKSLGTAVASEVFADGVLSPAHALFLTPVERSVRFLDEGSALGVIGTADPLYHRDAIQRSLAAHPEFWHVLPGLDHGLERPGDVSASLAGLTAAVGILRALLTPA